MESPLHVAASSTPASVPARPPDPCTLVLFGATGDLAHRKIVPALFELSRNGELPSPFGVVAASTSVKAAEAYRTELRQSVERFAPGRVTDEKAWGAFASSVDTVAGDHTRPEAFVRCVPRSRPRRAGAPQPRTGSSTWLCPRRSSRRS
jgi:glucose-6-phosphate 1-dehydrogenase